MSSMLKHSRFGEVRIERKGDDFLFCAKDVCDALGHTNSRVAVQMLDNDESVVRKVYIRSENGVNQYREMLFVTESGLYALIIRSNKPAARAFRKWITSEVLPALRKYGVYSTDAKIMERAERKREEKTVKQLLTAIDSRLSATDRRLVARQCQTGEYDV